MNRCFYIIALFLAFASCKKKNTPAQPVDLGKDYYPSTLGKYVIYEADSTVYDEFTHLPTNYKYQIKEKIEELFTDSEGKPALRLMRYIKKYDPNVAYSAMPWTVKDAWQVNVSATDVEVVEENVRFTKLIFPVKEGSTWNGNAKNTNDEWDYVYLGIDAPQTINSVGFDKVLTVKQKDYRTLISYQYYIEKYAKGTGLVYREIQDLYSGTVVSGVPVEDRIEKGTIYKLSVIDYGKE
ncbi:MAG: hypothetical protein ACXVPQ_08885 [Bacteroidia bacterium]